MPAASPSPPRPSVRVSEDGELEVRGPSVMAGYLDDDASAAFTEDGYVRTGDLGEITADGFVFSARRGDVLRLGGFLVNPQEIEDFLLEDDAIAAASVVAAEHDGAPRPVAFVVGDADEDGDDRALPRAAGGLQGPAPRDRARRAPDDRQPERPQGPARGVAPDGRRGTPRRHQRKEPRMSASTPEQVAAAPPAQAAGDAIDWAKLASLPEFKELHESRRRYTLGGFALQTGALLLLMALLGLAPDAMAKAPFGDLSWALIGGIAVVVLTFVMALAYAHKSKRVGGDVRARARACAGAEAGREVRPMSAVFAVTGDFNGLAVAIFAVVLAVTLGITRWAATRTKTASEFYTAGRGISGRMNGIAIAGDYLSASTFLGYAGLMFLFGFDGWIIGLAACMSFIPVLYLLAERMRNSGKFTLADVLSLPPAGAPGARRGGDDVAAHQRHLPRRPARRRRRARAGAGGDRLLDRRAHLRRVHDDLHRLRRHARDDLDPDRQGGSADDRGHHRRGRRDGEVRLQPRRRCSTRRRRSRARARRSSARACT